MSWGKIKKAINSTVGTSGFKPLDYIIRYDNKMFVASGSVFLEIPNTNKTLTFEGNKGALSTIVDLCSFTPKIRGTARLKVNLTVFDNTNDLMGHAHLYIYINGQLVNTITTTNTASGSGSQTTADIFSNIDFNANDVIELKLQAQTSGGSSIMQVSVTINNNIQVLADVKDKLIEV